ncbi:MAG: diguanylate cyclase, partial [Paenibacillaceae bacterium]
TTHDLDDVEQLCSRLIVVNHGKIVEDGPVESLIHKLAPFRHLVIDLQQPSEDLLHPAATTIKLEKVVIRVKDSKVIGVLTPYFGSFYFGTLMIAIHDAALQVGASVVIIRTTDIDPQDLLANDHVVGWIIVQSAVSHDYASKLTDLGKPIVAIGNRIPPEYGQVVVSDNEQGMMHAVEHFIEHGHRQIAFIGYSEQDDMKARYTGYKKALEKHGIPFNSDLVINSEVQGNESGWIAAEKIIGEKLPCTAIVACTDITAIGLIKHLEDMGYSVPEDYAIIGYDDSYAAHSNFPSVSSVNQNLDGIAGKAVELLMDQLAGKPRLSDIVYIPSSFKIRSSCGCPKHLHVTHSNTSGISNQSNDHAVSMVNNFEMYQFMISSNKPGIEDLASLMVPYFQWGCLASHQMNALGETILSIDQHFYFKSPYSIIDIKTISPEQFPPLPFYSSRGNQDIVSQAITHIIPIRVGNSEQSILALVSSEDHAPSTVPYFVLVQYLDLLAFSLERKASHQELLKQTDNYRRTAEQLEIVSRTSNDGIWDWDLEANTIECNGYLLRLLGFIPRTSTSTIHQSRFETLIHPDDLELLKAHMQSHLIDYSPFLFEFRIRHQDGNYIWLSTAGEAMRKTNGQAIRLIGSVRDISDRKRYEHQMVFLAFHDPLTGLVNRTRFYTLIKEYVSCPARQPFALLLLDLDGFKSVNDLFGHQMGDQVLIYVASLLKEMVSLPDHIARFGGDEFVILLPLDPVTDIHSTADTIIRTIKASLNQNYSQINVTGSLGISMFPQDSLDPEVLIKYADTAMYIAKHEEKNAYRLFHPSMLKQQGDKRL